MFNLAQLKETATKSDVRAIERLLVTYEISNKIENLIKVNLTLGNADIVLSIDTITDFVKETPLQYVDKKLVMKSIASVLIFNGIEVTNNNGLCLVIDLNELYV